MCNRPKYQENDEHDTTIKWVYGYVKTDKLTSRDQVKAGDRCEP